MGSGSSAVLLRMSSAGFSSITSRLASRPLSAMAAALASHVMTAPAEIAGVSLFKLRDWIAGLEKGLSIIEAFDDAWPRLTASQAGERCGLTRTAARRYLLTLAHLGYVATDGKLFWLTPRVLRLGQSYLESARLPRIVQPFLQRITAGTQEIAYVSVLDGDETVYIARNGSNRSMNTGFVLGARVPAQVTAAGMLILALGVFLPIWDLGNAALGKK